MKKVFSESVKLIERTNLISLEILDTFENWICLGINSISTNDQVLPVVTTESSNGYGSMLFGRQGSNCEKVSGKYRSFLQPIKNAFNHTKYHNLCFALESH